MAGWRLERASATVTITVRPQLAGEFMNVAGVSATEPDPDLNNNEAAETTTVRPPP